jgi:transcriptional regulator with XRE-family HTH domain
VFGDAQEFLGLTDDEMLLIRIHEELASAVRPLRVVARLSQAQLARRLESSQSRVAKIEAGDPSVSLDLLIRTLLILGQSPVLIGRLVASASSRPSASSSLRPSAGRPQPTAKRSGRVLGAVR